MGIFFLLLRCLTWDFQQSMRRNERFALERWQSKKVELSLILTLFLQAPIESFLLPNLDQDLSYDVIIFLALARQFYVSSSAEDAVFTTQRQTHSFLYSICRSEMYCRVMGVAVPPQYSFWRPDSRFQSMGVLSLLRNRGTVLRYLLISLPFPTFPEVQPVFKLHWRCIAIESVHHLCLQIGILPSTVPSLWLFF
jgi:hypothetical protein